MTSSIQYINIFSSVAHTYKRGTSVVTKLIRNNEEFAFIGRNSHYNSEYQYTISIDTPIVLQQVNILIIFTIYAVSSKLSFISRMINYLRLVHLIHQQKPGFH